MRRFLTTTLCVALFLTVIAGCQRPAPQPAPPQAAVREAPSGPAFDVTLWDGTITRGDVAFHPDGTVTVSGKTFKQDDIRFIQQVSSAKAAAPVAGQSSSERYAPLSDDALAQYRMRADEASSRHPGSDSIFCLDQGEDVLNKDGTQIYRYHALHLILKESARGVANVSIGFAEGRTRARFLFARTVAPDGASQWAGDSTFTVSVPPQAAQFVDTRTRVLSGQVPGSAVGAFVEYAYELEDYNPEVKDFFFPGFSFQSDKPVLDSIVDIFVPAGTPLNFVSPNMPAASAAPARLDRDASDGYRWEMHDVAPITPEPFMPDASDVVPRIQASLFFQWSKLMSVMGGFQKERVETTGKVKTLADEITREATTDDEKVAAIYHWVERNINYLSIKASLSSGWAGHAASETLSNGYGDCTDVAVLVASLCRSVGVDAYPAIVKTNDAGKMETDIPVPDGNHAITLVYPDGQPRFIDATAQDYRYPYFRSDDHGVKAIINMKEEIVDVPVPAPEDNMRTSRQEITLSPDGSATLVEHNAYTGSYEAGVRGFWRSVPPEMQSMMMVQYLQSRAPGAVMQNFTLGDLENLSKQLTMNIEYRLPVIATKMQDLYIFTLPNFAQKFPEATLETRVYDVATDTTQEFDTSVVIFLPDGYEFAAAPDPLTVSGKHLSFEGSVTQSDDKRALVAKQVFKRLTNRVPVADYAQYRSDAAAIASWTDLKIVLKKASQGPATEVTQ